MSNLIFWNKKSAGAKAPKQSKEEFQHADNKIDDNNQSQSDEDEVKPALPPRPNASHHVLNKAEGSGEVNSTSDQATNHDVHDASNTPNDQQPVLTDEEAEFLQRVTSDLEVEPSSSSRRATLISDNGEVLEEFGPEDEQHPEIVPLPDVSDEEQKELEMKTEGQIKDEKPQTWIQRWNQISFVPSTNIVDLGKWQQIINDKRTDYVKQRENNTKIATAKKEVTEKAAQQTATANTLMAAAEKFKSQPQNATTSKTKFPTTISKTNQELAQLLSTINLSHLNNSLISVSAETSQLLHSFNTVLRDLINGVPSAYSDLEKLLSERETQLEKLFGSLPPFLQTLVRSAPTKMYAVLAPQLAAAVSLEGIQGSTDEEGGFGIANTSVDDMEAENSDATATADSTKNKAKKRSLIPSLKSLISKKGTVAAMLRSIFAFLELRFPLFLTGPNVLMSLAVFVLLFVFWYCHKRGKETRLLLAEVDPEAGMVPIDPSLDTLEWQTSLELSAEELKKGMERFEELRAEEVPLGDDDDEAEKQDKELKSVDHEMENKKEPHMVQKTVKL